MNAKKIFAAFAVLASTLMICACASNEPKPDYDQTRYKANSAYQEVDNDTAE